MCLCFVWANEQGISPYAFAMLGVAASIAFSIVGAAWYGVWVFGLIDRHVDNDEEVPLIVLRVLVYLSLSSTRGILLTGASLLGASVKSPRIRSKNLIR
jgi:hypothetical protein